jgi:hypothetical protein
VFGEVKTAQRGPKRPKWNRGLVVGFCGGFVGRDCVSIGLVGFALGIQNGMRSNPFSFFPCADS